MKLRRWMGLAALVWLTGRFSFADSINSIGTGLMQRGSGSGTGGGAERPIIEGGLYDP
jgi:hypothetical protein